MAKIKQESFHSGTVDSEMLSEAMLTRPQIFKNIVRERYAQKAPILALTELLGEGIGETTYDEETYTWGILGQPKLSAMIISTSGTAKVGNTWKITLSGDAWFEKGAVLGLEDDTNHILLVSDAVDTPKGKEFFAQVKGSNTDYTLPGELIATGKFVHFSSTNYQEASTRGHRLTMNTPNKLINCGTITRSDFDITGTALTTGILYEDMKENKAGGRDYYRGFMPMGVNPDGTLHLDFHIMQTENNLMNGRSSMDFVTGKTFNTIDGKKVVSGDGFEVQLEGSETIWFSPNDNAFTLTQKLNKFVTFRAMTDSMDTVDQIVMGGSGLGAVFNYVLRDYMVTNGEQVHINIGPDKKAVAGMRITEFVTPKGRVKYVYNPYFDGQGKVLKTIKYQGVDYKVSSFKGYFMPIRQLTDIQGRPIPSIQTMARAKRGINRNLIGGMLGGMTGLTQMLSGKGQERFAASYNRYASVQTGTDADMFMFLTEKMFIIHNPSEFARLMPLH